MYSSKTDLFPTDQWTQSRLRILDHAIDEVYDVWPWDLADRELYWMVDVTMAGAADHPDARWRCESRAYLHGLVRRALPHLDEYTAEIWELKWNVDPVVNRTWLTVTFPGVLVVYLMYVDWQRLWAKVRPARGLAWPSSPSIWAITSAGLLALTTGALWDTSLSLRPLFNLGRLLDQRTIWLLVLPVVPFLLLRSSVALGREIVAFASLTRARLS